MSGVEKIVLPHTKMIASIIVDELCKTELTYCHERPYAFALLLGQQCNYLGYAIATSDSLAKTVENYIELGYRYQGVQKMSDEEAIRTWLKWANPDDGWHYGDFGGNAAVQRYLDIHNGDDLLLRNSCFEQLKSVITQYETDLTLGVIYGANPEDFRDSVIQIYGKAGHKSLVTEYEAMRRLDADICRL
ncbi:hypothetical protein [Acaryochloris sp. CCMEE 5410]|uniref:hypothetical protein n=1 Tax=Acaryochloris sp. CCMEE 5410 TaxID=310037 RepID=UPI00024839F1|nr:hypothetical protein [Acaryochloris sp. CCMEE 5410]KAI9134620.1 hypothetical protein ON05_015960 [Acaryochloris sp. CCMEE 5410]